MEEIVYNLRPGTRYAEKTKRHYDVREIIISGEVIGSLHTADGYLWGEIEWPGGTREHHGDCTLNHSGAEPFMVRNIMAHRSVGPGQDWRASLPLRGDYIARRAD